MDRYFDPFYTLVPIPYVWLQLFTTVAGNPVQIAPDPNTSLGVFLDYNQKQHYAYVQFLVDDLTISSQSTTVLKGAWSLGYRINTEVGSFGFYHAGATKFTYQATRTTSPYPYLYYPTNTYDVPGNSIAAGAREIPYFDNYIGYQYGENNLAFRAEYENRFDIVGVNGGVEYVVSGDKAPLNPWHAGASIDDVGGTQLLDSNRLEHTLLVDAGVAVSVFEDIDVIFEGEIGFVANELALIDAPASDGGEQYFIPGTGIKLLYSAFVGVQYNYNQHEPEWRKRYNRPQLRR